MANSINLLLKITAATGGAAKDIDDLSAKLKGTDAAATQSSTTIQRSNETSRKSMQKLGSGAIVAGGLVVAGFGLAISKTLEFDTAMSNAGAAAGANADQLGKLREAALKAGADTSFSATEAATAEGELAKAGVSTATILNGALNGALSLAAAGQIALGDAATYTATAMNIFGIAGSQTGHIADVLAAGAGKSATDVADMGAALEQGGLVAKQTGLSFEETVGTLALFAQNALTGSDAGTSLKTMLQRLTPQSKEAKDKMEELGISAYDSQGKFIGAAQFAGNLKDSLKDLTPEARNSALAVIFGSDATRAASILYEAGAKGVKKWTNRVDDQGYAAEQAGKKTDNLAGDLERLQGSFESALIGAGSESTGVLRDLVQVTEGAVDIFSSLPGPVQAAATGMLVLGGAGLLIAGIAIKVAPAVGAVQAFTASMLESAGAATVAGVSYEGFGATAAATSTTLTAASAGGSVGFFGKLGAGFTNASVAAATFAPKLASIGTLLSAVNPEILAVGLADIIAPVKDFGGEYEKSTRLAAAGLIKTTAAGRTQGEQLALLKDRLKDSREESHRLNKEWKESRGENGPATQAAIDRTNALKSAVRQLSANLGETGGKAKTAQEAIKQVAQDQAQFAQTTSDGAKAFDDAANRTQAYTDAVRGTYDAQFALKDANDALKDTLSSGTASVDDQKRALLDVTDAAAAFAIQQLGPGATATEQQQAGLAAQLDSLKLLKAQYPQMGPFIDDYSKKLLEASAAADQSNGSNQAAIDVLNSLKAKYPELGPEIDKLVGKVQALQGATQASDVTNQAAIGVLDALKAKYPQLRGEIDLLIGAINGIPPTKSVDIHVNNQAALDAINATATAIINLPGRIDTRLAIPAGASVRRSADGGVIPGFAAGGTPNGISWVGERGKELFIAPQGGRILSHSDSMRAVAGAGSGGGSNYNISVSVGVGAHPAEAGAAVVNAIKQFERSNGKAWRN